MTGTHARTLDPAGGIAVLAGEAPGLLHTTPFDLGATESAAQTVEEVVSRWGRLDSLVSNAGVWDGGRLRDLDPDRWWDVVERNLRGTAALVRAAIPALSSSPRPSITLVSSVVGEIGFAGDTAYASSKAALVGLARSLAKELASAHVRVNVVQPGFVETEMTDGVPEASRERILGRTLLRRFGTPEEVATAVTFLSEDATFMTGAVLTVDGGWSL